MPLRDELRAGDQKHAKRLGVHALDGDLTKPTGSHDMSKTKSVIGIGLVDLKGERGFSVTGIEANDRKSVSS